MHIFLTLVAVIAIIPAVLVIGSETNEITPFAHATNKVVCGIQLCSEIEGGWDAWSGSMDDTMDVTDYSKAPANAGIPLHKGYHDGFAVYYIITDSSEATHATVITESQGWPVQHSPSLAATPDDALSATYMFTNGIRGSGVHGFQSEVFTSAPGRDAAGTYSPLAGHIHVVWNPDATPKILNSEDAILAAAEAGDLELVEIDVVINMPRFVVSPTHSEMLDRLPERIMALPLHAGFYDGANAYGLILDSSDRMQADAITLATKIESNYSPNLGAVIGSDDNSGNAYSNVYIFTNGIEGPGIDGFQGQVYASGLGAESYTPLAMLVNVMWADGVEPSILKSEAEIMAAMDAGNVVLDETQTVTNMPLIAFGGMFVVAGDVDAGDMDDNNDISNKNVQSEMAEPDDSARMHAGEDHTAPSDDMNDSAAATDDDNNDNSTLASSSTVAQKPLMLARASVAVDLPLHMGHYDGQDVYYIITDASDAEHADIISAQQNWRVELAPFLAGAPDASLATVYVFGNGMDGSGIHGFQAEVFSTTPESPQYSALVSPVHVMWSDTAEARILDSEAAILAAVDSGEVTFDMTHGNIVLNMPQIVWPGGQMPLKDDTLVNDATPYGGGQVTNIDTEEMKVTFVAHRGWGPDGRTIYYIVTDATPSGPAEMMGVVNADTSADLLLNPAAVDLYQFANGIPGPGPLGFQPGIASSALGDPGYSPMWRIYIIQWNDPDNDARLLQTMNDISAYLDAGMITVSLARPMDSDHIVNCPFLDPFQ